MAGDTNGARQGEAGRRVLRIEVPLDIAGAESAVDISVAIEAMEHALSMLRQMGRAPTPDERDDRRLVDAGGREVGWLYVRREDVPR